MGHSIFQIGADGIDVDQLVEDLRTSVSEKMQGGHYTDVRVARAERANLQHLQNGEEFLDFYLNCLRDAAFVDIGDFEIIERRARLGWLLVRLKRVIWSLLKFYTFRLWSQQNQVNGLLLSAVETAEGRNRERIRALEERLAKLEAERPAAPRPSA